MTENEAETCQKWAGMDGVTAFHLIERHADGWEDIAMMMGAWHRANTPNLQPVISWLANGCDPKEAVKELEIYQHKMRPNVRIQPTDAALSRQVGCNDGLGLDNLKGK